MIQKFWCTWHPELQNLINNEISAICPIDHKVIFGVRRMEDGKMQKCKQINTRLYFCAVLVVRYWRSNWSELQK